MVKIEDCTPIRRPSSSLLAALHRRQIGGARRENGTRLLRLLKLTHFSSELVDLAHESEPAGPALLSTFVCVASADGRWIASSHADHSVRVVETGVWKFKTRLLGHPRSVWSMAFCSHAPRLLATGCLGGELRVWDFAGNAILHHWKHPTRRVLASLTFHPTEELLAFVAGPSLFIWDLSQEAPFAELHAQSPFNPVSLRWVQFCPRGKWLYTATLQRTGEETNAPSRILASVLNTTLTDSARLARDRLGDSLNQLTDGPIEPDPFLLGAVERLEVLVEHWSHMETPQRLSSLRGFFNSAMSVIDTSLSRMLEQIGEERAAGLAELSNAGLLMPAHSGRQMVTEAADSNAARYVSLDRQISLTANRIERLRNMLTFLRSQLVGIAAEVAPVDAINEVMANAMENYEPRVATNIRSTTYRIQQWALSSLPNLSPHERILVPHVKIHNDSSVSLSPDGSLLAAFCPRGGPATHTLYQELQVICTKTGTCQHLLNTGPNSVVLAFSPDSATLCIGQAAKRFTEVEGVNQPPTARLLHLETGEFTDVHVEHPSARIASNNSAAWAPDGQLVLGSNRGDLLVVKPCRAPTRSTTRCDCRQLAVRDLTALWASSPPVPHLYNPL